jgi:translation initiation factor 1
MISIRWPRQHVGRRRLGKLVETIAMRSRGTSGGPVFTTQLGRMCPSCSKPVAACCCRPNNQPAASDGIVRVGRQTKGRKGKGVTTITGVPLRGAELATLASELKRKCGSGGTVRDGTIEIQGDHRDLLVQELEGRGWRVKRVGG